MKHYKTWGIEIRGFIDELLTCLKAQWTEAGPAAESRRLDTVDPAL